MNAYFLTVSEEEKTSSKPPTQEDLNKFFRTPIGQTKKIEDPIKKRLELEKDVRYCLQLDTTDVVPILQGKHIVNAL